MRAKTISILLVGIFFLRARNVNAQVFKKTYKFETFFHHNIANMVNECQYYTFLHISTMREYKEPIQDAVDAIFKDGDRNRKPDDPTILYQYCNDSLKLYLYTAQDITPTRAISMIKPYTPYYIKISFKRSKYNIIISEGEFGKIHKKVNKCVILQPHAYAIPEYKYTAPYHLFQLVK